MKRAVILLIMIAFSVGAFSQVSVFTLKNLEKLKTLSTDAYISVEVDIRGDSLETGTVEYQGSIEELSEAGLMIVPGSISTNTLDYSGVSFNSNYYSSDFNGEATRIDPNTISSIHYQSNGAGIVSGISGTLAVLGYTAALIVAPLVSIDYKGGGEFKQDRYFKVAGAGLITVGVTLPLAILFSGKTFEFKDLLENDEYDDYWEFDYDLTEYYEE